MAERLTATEWQTIKNWVTMAEARKKRLVDDRWDRILRLYQGIYPDVYVGDAATDIHVNMFYPNVKQLEPLIFFENPRITIRAQAATFEVGRGVNRRVVDGVSSAQLLTDAMNYLKNELGIKFEMRRVRLDALLFAYAVGMVGYNAEFGIDEEEREFLKDESFYFVRVSPRDFLIDPNAQSPRGDDARYMGRIVRVPLEDVLDNPNYTNKDREALTRIADLGGGEDVQKTERVYQDSPQARMLELIELWVKPSFQERRKGDPGKVVVLAKKFDKPLRVDDWPYQIEGFPFEIVQFNPLPDRFVGMADIDTYEPQQREKSAIRSAMVNHIRRGGNRKIVAASDVTEEEIVKFMKSDDWAILQVGGDPRTKVMIVPDAPIPPDVYNVDQLIERDANRISGLDDEQRGIRSVGRQTATQVAVLERRSGTRTLDRLDLMADFYVNVTRKLIQLLKQFADQPIPVRIITAFGGVEYRSFTKEDIQGEYDVEVDIQSMSPRNEEVERQQFLAYLQILGDAKFQQGLGAQGMTVDMKELVDELNRRFKIKRSFVRPASPGEQAALAGAPSEGGMPGGEPVPAGQTDIAALLSQAMQTGTLP